MDSLTSQSFFSRQINNIRQFAKEPDDVQYDIPFSNKLGTLAVVFIINLLLAVFLGWLMQAAITALKLDELMDEHKLNGFFNEFPLPVFALLSIIIIPLLEETIFRLPIRFSVNVINILFGAIMLYILSAIYSGYSIAFTITALIVLGSCISLFFIYNKRITSALSYFWKSNFPIVFYVFTLVFALVHLGNYPLSLVVALLCPLLVSPQFVLGFLAGYLRVRLGFFWGAALHMLHNGLFLIPILFSPGMITLPVEVTTTDYSLSIKKGQSNTEYEMQYYANADSIGIENYSLKSCLALLLNKQEKFIETSNDIVANKSLSVKYVNKNKLNDSTDVASYKNTIVNHLKKAYHFKLETTSKNFPHLEVYVKDSIKLITFKSKLDKDPSAITDAKTINFKNADLKIITNTLNNEFAEVQLHTNFDSKKEYTFKVPKKDFDAAKSYLQTRLGLGFKESTKKVAITTVVFE